MAWTMRSWSARPTAPCTRQNGWVGTRSRPPCSLRTSHKLPPNFPFPGSRSLPATAWQLFRRWHRGCSFKGVDAGAGRGCRTGGREMRYEEFEVMQTRFNDLDRRVELVLLRWGGSHLGVLIGLSLLSAEPAPLSLLHLSPTTPRTCSLTSPPRPDVRPRPCFFLRP